MMILNLRQHQEDCNCARAKGGLFSLWGNTKDLVSIDTILCAFRSREKSLLFVHQRGLRNYGMFQQ